MAQPDKLQQIEKLGSDARAATETLGTSGIARPTAPDQIAIPEIRPDFSRIGKVVSSAERAYGSKVSSARKGAQSVDRSSYQGPRFLGEGLNVDSLQNAAGYAKSGVIPPTQVQSQGWFQKAASYLESPVKNTISVIGKAFNAATAATAAGMNLGASAISAAAEKAAPEYFGTEGRSFTDLYKENLKEGSKVAKAYLEGKGTATQIADVTAPGKRSLAQTAALTAADILLDPTTYITLGAGSGAKVITKEGAEIILNKEGTALFKKLAAEAAEKATPEVAQKMIQDQIAEVISAGGRLDGREIINLIDKGGIKLGGKTIKYTDKVVEPALKIMKDVSQSAVHALPSLNKAGQYLRDMLVPVENQIADKNISRIIAKYRTSQPAIYDQVASKVDDLVKGLSKEEAEIIRYGRGNEEMLANLGDVAREKADRIYGFLDVIGDEERKVGIPLEKIPNYMHQAYKETPREITKKLDSLAADLKIRAEAGEQLSNTESKLLQLFQGDRPKKLSGQPSYVQEKFFADPALGKAAGLTPLDSLGDILQNRARMHASTVAKQGMLEELVQKYGYKALKESKKVSAGEVAATNEVLKSDVPNAVLRDLGNGQKAYIPSDVNRALSRVLKKEVTSDDLPRAIRTGIEGYDFLTRAFKSMVTSPFPAFTVRNVFDSTYRQVLDVGLLHSARPGLAGAAAKMALGKATDEAIELAGVKYTLGGLKDIAERYGVINTGEVAQTGLQKLRKITDPFENFTRLNQFIANIDLTGDIASAAERTLKFQFDYSNLTNFEREVMQRIFPFYTFTRKNIPFTLERIAKQPGTFAGIDRAYENFKRELGSDDPDSLPDYIRNNFSLAVGTDQQGNRKYLSELGLSYEAANQFLNLTNKRGIESNIGGSLNPVLKMAGELAQRRSYFTGKSFDQQGGRDAKSQMALLKVLNAAFPNIVKYREGYNTNQDGTEKYVVESDPGIRTIIENLPTSRATSVVSDWFRPDKGWRENWIKGLSGGKIYNVDETASKEANSYYRAKDTVDQKIKLLENLGYIRTRTDGKRVVNTYFKSGSPDTDAAMRAEAQQLIDAQYDPESYVSSQKP